MANTDPGEYDVLIATSESGVLKDALAAVGSYCCFVFAETLDETLLKMSSRHFGLMLVDRYYATEAMLAIAKNIHAATPLIALTPSPDISERKRLIADGFDDCLVKPLTVEKVDEMVRLWLNGEDFAEIVGSVQNLLVKFKGNHATVTTLWHSLYEELPALVGDLDAALEKRDWRHAYETAHKLNGSAKVCHLQQIGETAGQMEKMLINQQYDLIGNCFYALQQKIARLLALRAFAFNQIKIR